MRSNLIIILIISCTSGYSQSQTINERLNIIPSGWGNTHIPYSNGDIYLTSYIGGGNGDLVFRTYNGTGYTNRFRITAGGRVGIGLDNPTVPLEISTPAGGREEIFRIKIADAPTDFFDIINSTGEGGQFIPMLRGYHISDNRVVFGLRAEINAANDNGSEPLLLFNARITDAVVQNRPLFAWNNFNQTKMTMLANGNLGIGIINPTYKLTVDGTISAKEVKVSTTPNSDYVFEPDYPLLPLSEVESHIKEKKHLPGIPSAEEFKQNGVGLGEMDDMLLRKVEELTLYVIEQNRSNAKFLNEIENLKEENKDLKHELIELKNSIKYEK